MSEPAPDPAPSGSIVLARDVPSGGIEVLMMQRTIKTGAFAGALTFPGGKVDAGDSGTAIRARCDGAEELDEIELAYRVSAIRELFEEAGILLARDADGRYPNAARTRALWPARGPLNDGKMNFAGFLELEGLMLALDALVYYAHFITPKIARRRFDSKFFLAAAPTGQEEDHDGGENTEAIWIRPADALAANESGERHVVFATCAKLDKLGRHASVDAVLAAARADTVYSLTPQFTETADGPRLTLPEGKGYHLTSGPVPPLPGGVLKN
jgi:8-oxo-dGTP pyrophosphatase MutT (NUDIX family)